MRFGPQFLMRFSEYFRSDLFHFNLNTSCVHFVFYSFVSTQITQQHISIMHTSLSEPQYSRCTSASPPLLTFLSFIPTFRTVPFNSFHAFHFAFSYTFQSITNSYSEAEHTRCRNIAISNRSLLVQSISS